jgi:hypothetical protein
MDLQFSLTLSFHENIPPKSLSNNPHTPLFTHFFASPIGNSFGHISPSAGGTGIEFGLSVVPEFVDHALYPSFSFGHHQLSRITLPSLPTTQYPIAIACFRISIVAVILVLLEGSLSSHGVNVTHDGPLRK